MASEEIQNPPNVKIEMENMMKEQIVLSEQRLRVLQYIGYGKRGSSIKENNFLELMKDLATTCTLLPDSVGLLNSAVRQGLNLFLYMSF